MLDRADKDAWLTCPVDEASRFFKRSEGPFEDWAASLPRQVRSESATLPLEDPSGELF